MDTRKTHNKKNKKILITAGPTWVAIDSVRVISNISSGQTGFLLTKEAVKRGYKTTLILGPTEKKGHLKNVLVKQYKYFDELSVLLKTELTARKYNVVLHAAAVSDYRPDKPNKAKIKSGIKNLTIRLKPAIKIVSLIKKFAPKTFLVMFKLEQRVSDSILISRARKALIDANADLAVANTITPRYKAFIIDGNKIYGQANSKEILTKKLFNVINQKLDK